MKYVIKLHRQAKSPVYIGDSIIDTADIKRAKQFDDDGEMFYAMIKMHYSSSDCTQIFLPDINSIVKDLTTL